MIRKKPKLKNIFLLNIDRINFKLEFIVSTTLEDTCWVHETNSTFKFLQIFLFFLVLQCIYSRKWSKKRLFYGGTKVIMIFSERHKWHKAAPYVYLVTTKIWGWTCKNCGNYGAMSISEHFWTWQTFLQTARVYLTVFSIYSDQLWYRECLVVSLGRNRAVGL